MGTLSAYACAKPPMAFSAPAWLCTATTPKRCRSLVRLKPSAAITAPRSWRNITGRMPALAALSMSGLEGKHVIVSTPSRLSISVM